MVLRVVTKKVNAVDVSETVCFLHAAGKRITPERKLLLRIIGENAHLDASEIYRLAREENPKINLSTVYRTVKLLKDLGLVESSNLGEDHDHYEVRLQDHYHFVCLGCGKVVEIPSVDLLKHFGEERDVEIVGIKLQLIGYCEECHKKRDRKKTGASQTLMIGEPKLPGPVAHTLDLQGVPLLEHPDRVSRALERIKTGEILEIITGDPRHIKMASRMLHAIEGIEFFKLWQECGLCHVVVRKVNDP